MLLGAAVAAQGVNVDLFFGYINALTELQSKYLTIDSSGEEETISINISGPYEYDMDVMNTLTMSEESVREHGWEKLDEDYDLIDTSFGKIKTLGLGNTDGSVFPWPTDNSELLFYLSRK